MQKGRLYVAGVACTFVGGCGLAGISIDSDVVFWIFAVMFSIGIGLCLAGYER